MKKLAIFILIAACFFACKDVINETPNSPFTTTPYQFTYRSFRVPNIPKDNPLTAEGVQLGRMLFYDPILSADSTQSCASCHNQSNAFTDNGRRFSQGIRGTEGKRNSMPIFNLMWHIDGFFWDKRADILKHQALIPIQDPIEMDENLGNLLVKLNNSEMYKEHFKKAFNTKTIDEELAGKALEQFMLSIVSASSKYDRVQLGLDTFTDLEKVGSLVFNIKNDKEATPLKDENDPQNPQNYFADCGHCHGTNLFMSEKSFTNGLPSNGDLGVGAITGNPRDEFRFKTPSLRNIEKTAPYMHDGRFKTLEEVVQFYLGDISKNSPVDLADENGMHTLKDSVYLSENHKAALIAFLKTLTDDELMKDERYSDPFK